MNQQFNGVIEFIHNNQGVPIKKITGIQSWKMIFGLLAMMQKIL